MNGSFFPLTERISYCPASQDPLCADIFKIETEKGAVLFDVGNGPNGLSAVLSVPDPVIVLSHFHADHVGNVPKIPTPTIYLSAETQKHTVPGIVITEPLSIGDDLYVLPFPNSHAKGSLVLQSGSMLFIGDALYPRNLNGKACYNTGLLKEEIELIEALGPDQIAVSHRSKPIIRTRAALALLKHVFDMRTPDEPYIYTDMPVFNEE